MVARVALLLAVLPVLAGLSACDTTTVTAFLERTWVPGSSAAYTGKVSPAPVGTRVAVQRLVGAAWTDVGTAGVAAVGTAGVAADGTYRVTLPSPGAATYRQRVVARSASGSQLAQSGESQYGNPAAGTVSAPIANWLRGRTGSASVAIYDATTGVTSYYGTNQHYFSASIAKVSILGTVLRRAAVQNRALTTAEKAHAVPMITQSSNDDATWLWNSVGGAPAVHAFQSSVGMNATVQDAAGRWGLASTTAADQARLVESVIWNNPLLRPADQSYARSLMRSVIPSQHWGVSAGAPAGATVELKNGWLPHDGAYRVNSIGHVYDATHNYVIAVLTSTPGIGTSSFNYGIATIQGVTRALWGQSPTSATANALVAPDSSDAGR